MVCFKARHVTTLQNTKGKGICVGTRDNLLYNTVYVLQSNHWVGTILLNSCKVIERPSKKDGFCFKLYNPLDQSIWAPRGPENETIGSYSTHCNNIFT